jgi:hypothetical protein
MIGFPRQDPFFESNSGSRRNVATGQIDIARHGHNTRSLSNERRRISIRGPHLARQIRKRVPIADNARPTWTTNPSKADLTGTCAMRKLHEPWLSLETLQIFASAANMTRVVTIYAVVGCAQARSPSKPAYPGRLLKSHWLFLSSRLGR